MRFVRNDAQAVNYLLWDHLFTPQKLVDGNRAVVSGAVVWDAAFTPYGAEESLLGSAVLKLRLPGQYVDEETGRGGALSLTHPLYYNYHRDYDPAIGRYVQVDPIGLAGGNNPYRYANANPVMYSDEDGLAPRGKGRKGKGAQGKGERGMTGGGSSGKRTNNPYKKCRPHPTLPDKILCQDPHTGRDVKKHKPADWDDYKKKREQEEIEEGGETCPLGGAWKKYIEPLIPEIPPIPAGGGGGGGGFKPNLCRNKADPNCFSPLNQPIVMFAQ